MFDLFDFGAEDGLRSFSEFWKSGSGYEDLESRYDDRAEKGAELFEDLDVEDSELSEREAFGWHLFYEYGSSVGLSVLADEYGLRSYED